MQYVLIVPTHYILYTLHSIHISLYTHLHTLYTLNNTRTVEVEPSTVCTVGSMSVWPGVVNVIAGSVNLTVDIRYA